MTSLPRFRIHRGHCMQFVNTLPMSKLAVSAVVLAAGLTAVSAQGSVVGAAEPGTMEETFTIPYTDFDDTVASGCGMVFAGCTGELDGACPNCVPHEVAGSITVLDDCTFRIQGWQFDGIGPAVEWCAPCHCVSSNFSQCWSGPNTYCINGNGHFLHLKPVPRHYLN